MSRFGVACGALAEPPYVVLCGSQTEVILPDLRTPLLSTTHGTEEERSYYTVFSASREETSVYLLSSATYFCSNEATDDRDRLYGLYAISTKSRDLEINYSVRTLRT